MGCASHRRSPWGCGVLGQAVDARAPRRAVLRHLAPRLEVRRDARALERPVQRVAERVLGPPVRARVADPPLSFGSIQRKVTNMLRTGPQRRAVARWKGIHA